MMRLASLAVAAALATASLSAPAFAQAGLAVGATVYGREGGEVGKITKVEAGNVVVDTGNLIATLPADVFGEGTDGPTIGWNKAELEQAITAANQEAEAASEAAQAEAKAAAEAALAAALVTGAEVYSLDNVLLGTVESVDPAGTVVVALDAGPVALPKAQMAVQADKLTFRATAADVRAAVAGATSESETETGG